MARNNNPKKGGNSATHPHKRHLTPVMLAVGAALAVTVLTIALVQQQQAGAQQSSSQIANSIGPIYPEVTVAKEKISSVSGTPLTELARTSSSVTIERTADVGSKSVLKDGQAELVLLHGVNAEGLDVIAVTLTNSGTSKFYASSLLITGATSNGLEPLSAYAIDDDYSAAVWGDIPKPSLTEPVLLNPGESVTAHIVGKWNVAAIGNEPITNFSMGAGYSYDITATEYKAGNNWSISMTDFKLS